MKKYIPKTKIGNRLNKDKRYRIVSFAICGFSVNLIYAFYNGILGVMYHSLWFISLCAYYIILSSMRFGIVMQDKHSISTERFILKFCGILLVILAFVLSISTYLSLVTNMAAKHQEIVMITIATYTFCKVTLAIINTIKIRKENALLLSAIRNIGCVDAAVSILSLQRSMLVSFEGMNKDEIYMMNAITGAGVFLFVLSLGIGMFLRSQKEYSKSERKGVKNMAKSKFVKANEKIAEKVTDGFQKVSNTVVDGYKKIEDKFVDQYLTKDGETVEEAKKRLRQEQENNK